MSVRVFLWRVTKQKCIENLLLILNTYRYTSPIVELLEEID